MQFIIKREALLKPLQIVCGVVERRQTLPILSHVLLSLDNQEISLTATDLEVEMITRTNLDAGSEGNATLPARKFMDICRALPEESEITITIEKDRAMLRAGRSRFTLATLPADEFPNIEKIQDAIEITVIQQDLKRLIEKTHFAMAQQDVRYYLNGLMLELTEGRMRAVATDGHRLSLCDINAGVVVTELRQVIVPRKGILELLRLLEGGDDPLQIKLGSNHIQVMLPNISFTSKLIDGKFPDYQRVLPSGGEKILIAGREPLRQALSRASILSNEKYRGVRLQLSKNLLRIHANNPEQEEAEEELEVEYSGGELEIGFNVSYMLDAVSAVDSERVQITFIDANSSCLIQSEEGEDCLYVVMPMRL